MEYSAEIKLGFSQLSLEMDRFVVGHDKVKSALLLALICREHLYLEGPTGCAKTMLAEITARAAGLNFFFYQMHRDTRISELLGGAFIYKNPAAAGEIISRKYKKGGLLVSEIAVLDDISRAPGESLNVLLRILNERAYMEEPIPLRTAIATSNPTDDSYYNEPLDPANLDRFLFQMKTSGLLQNPDQTLAENLIRRYSSFIDAPLNINHIKPGLIDEAYRALPQVRISPDFAEAYRALLQDLVRSLDDQSSALVSDRTFLVKSLKAFKAHALLNGRNEVRLDDLVALEYMTAFRLPDSTRKDLEKTIDDLRERPGHDSSDQSRGQEAETTPPSGENHPDGSISISEAPQRENALNSPSGRPDNESFVKFAEATPVTSGEDQSKIAYDPESACPRQKKDGDFLVYNELEVMNDNQQVVGNLDQLLEILRGRLQKRITEEREHQGGIPRRYRPMKDLDELADMHPIDAWPWLKYPHARFPNVLKKERETSGGHVAILRDISDSMTGSNSQLAGTLIMSIIRIARAKKMILGYIEFNHESFPLRRSKCFFTRDYKSIIRKAVNSRCFGMTNYENAFSDALVDFPRKGRGNKHIVFITDGRPSSGDLLVKEPLAQAQSMGVCIHCIFIGSHEYPEILRTIARNTGGSLFSVVPKGRHRIYLQKILDN